MPIRLTDDGEAATEVATPGDPTGSAAPAIVVERPAAGVEIELIGGRRVQPLELRQPYRLSTSIVRRVASRATRRVGGSVPSLILTSRRGTMVATASQANPASNAVRVSVTMLEHAASAGYFFAHAAAVTRLLIGRSRSHEKACVPVP